MILLEVQCPRCKKIKRYLNYNIKKREQLQGKKTRCYVCEKEFVIVGKDLPKYNRIIKEIMYDGN